MRDPERLDGFYDGICLGHKEKMPDCRIGQLISNFLEWLYTKKNIRDIFYIEDDKFYELFEEYIQTL